MSDRDYQELRESMSAMRVEQRVNSALVKSIANNVKDLQEKIGDLEKREARRAGKESVHVARGKVALAVLAVVAAAITLASQLYERL